MILLYHLSCETGGFKEGGIFIAPDVLVVVYNRRSPAGKDFIEIIA
ncbi:MAG: hypothetical protein WC324_05415 [Candidatus Omnitrophota bacterium]